MRPMILRMVLLAAVCGWETQGLSGLPTVPNAAKEEFGITSGTPQMSGFVFINGRYLDPPYTVTRIGNGLFINRIQIEQPVPWSHFEPPPSDRQSVADDNFEDVNEAPTVVPAGGTVDDALKEADVPVKAKPSEKKTDDLDELFGETEKGEKPVPKKGLPTAEAALTIPSDKKASAEKAPAALQRPKRDIAAEKQRLKDYLEKMRRTYELGLARNEIYFFGESHNRINGNYGTARTLMNVLPDALYIARSPEDLLDQLQAGGVYFIDLRVARLLFKNKITYRLLKERLKKIRQAEAFEAARRKRLREATPTY